jgi:hypothetical protein
VNCEFEYLLLHAPQLHAWQPQGTCFATAGVRYQFLSKWHRISFSITVLLCIFWHNGSLFGNWHRTAPLNIPGVRWRDLAYLVGFGLTFQDLLPVLPCDVPGAFDPDFFLSLPLACPVDACVPFFTPVFYAS